MVPRKPLLLAIIITVLAGFFFTIRRGFTNDAHIKTVLDGVREGVHHPTPAKPKEPVHTPCTEHLGWLEPYQFTYPIQYVARDVIAREHPGLQRTPLTIKEELLFEEFSTVNLAEAHSVRFEKCLPPLELEVPHASMVKIDASNMIFGMQTTMNRLKDTVKHLARWLPNTGARLYAIVIEDHDLAANDDDMAALEKQFQEQGMNVSVVHPVRPTDSFAQRYFSLVNVMYAARDEKTQWISTIDDDTFFPSMWDLQELLKRHDCTKPQYIGSLSEDWWAINHYGMMGFGGAGIFLSLPMAKTIDDQGLKCKEHLRTTAGDISVMDCIYRFSTTKLTHIASLHQVDLSGDISGFYESGREMTSVHHWKEGPAAGAGLEMEKMHLVADICDSCFLQRWQFDNEILLSNGFSITSYPQGHLTGKKPGGLLGSGVGGNVKKIDLGQMEKTWGGDINVDHSLAPLRNKMSEDQKVGYKLLDSQLVKGEEVGAPGQKVVRQVYFKEGEEGKTKDSVMVLNWRSGPPIEVPKEEEKKPEEKKDGKRRRRI